MRSSRSLPADWLKTGRSLPPDGDPDSVARAGHAEAGSAAAALDARAWRLRARLFDHDDLGGAAAAAAYLHDLGLPDRPCDRGGRVLRADAVTGGRALERFVPHAARAASSLHARRPRPDGVLPAADPLHAEPLDDDAARARVLLRLLPVRAAVSRPLPGRAAAVGLRPRTRRPARAARDRARGRPRRWQLPAQGLGARAVSDRRLRHDRGLRPDDPARAGGRRARPGLRRLPRVHQAKLEHLLAGERRQDVPDRELSEIG